MNENEPQVNPGKSLIIEINASKYNRIPIKTHIITKEDSLESAFVPYVKPLLLAGDIVFISEKAIACIQSRAIPLEDIKPRKLATKLSHYVHKTPHGIGLGMPETMEMALRECGVLRILFAAVISVFGKLIGKKGWFYHVAGPKARAIDGPTPNTIPPYNRYVVLGPKDPVQVSKDLSKLLDNAVVTIVDINDLGGNILGTSDSSVNENLLVSLLSDNPLGQGTEQTPCGIIRRV